MYATASSNGSLRRRKEPVHAPRDAMSHTTDLLCLVVCDESAIAYNPHGGKLLLWRHRALGNLFRCTLCFYDALAQSSLGA